MAKTKVNKSEAIREYLKANPDKMPKDVAADLTRSGIKVNAGMVSTIKSKMKSSKGKKPGKRGRKPGSSMTGNQAGSFGELGAMLDLVEKIGLGAAENILKKLREFKERL